MLGVINVGVTVTEKGAPVGWWVGDFVCPFLVGGDDDVGISVAAVG